MTQVDKTPKSKNDKGSENWGCALVIVAYLAMLTILIVTDNHGWAIAFTVGPIVVIGLGNQ